MFNNQSKNNNTMDVRFLYGVCCFKRSFEHFCLIDFTSFNPILRDYEQNNISRDRGNALCTDQI